MISPYSDSERVFYESYEKDLTNRGFQVRIKKFEERNCEATIVKAVLENVFGESILEKDYELPDTKLEGDIGITGYEKDSRIYLNFTTNTKDLLNCYDQVQFGPNTQILLTNPLDVTEIFPPSCNKKKHVILLISSSNTNKLQKTFLQWPLLHPPPQDTIVDALLDEEAMTIQLTITPAAPLTCLMVTVNSTTISIDRSGKMDISTCPDKELQMEVRVNAEQDNRTVLTKSIRLPKSNIGRLSLVYLQHRKSVIILGGQGTFVCTGNFLALNTLAGTGELIIDWYLYQLFTPLFSVDAPYGQHCKYDKYHNYGVGRIFMKLLTIGGTHTRTECRKACSDNDSCYYWTLSRNMKFNNVSCQLSSGSHDSHHSLQYSHSRYRTRYDSGYKWCTLPEDNGTWCK